MQAPTELIFVELTLNKKRPRFDGAASFYSSRQLDAVLMPFY